MEYSAEILARANSSEIIDLDLNANENHLENKKQNTYSSYCETDVDRLRLFDRAIDDVGNGRVGQLHRLDTRLEGEVILGGLERVELIRPEAQANDSLGLGGGLVATQDHAHAEIDDGLTGERESNETNKRSDP